MDGMSIALPFHNTAELDLLNFGSSLSLDICKFGQYVELLDKAKYGGLVILLGAGGVVLYKARHKQITPSTSDHEKETWISSHNVLKWIFEGDPEGDVSLDPIFSSFLKGCRFGLLLPQSNKCFTSDPIISDGYMDDLSLNSLSMKRSNKKFLKHPLYSKDESGNRKNSKSNVQDNDETQTSDKRKIYNLRIKRPEDKQIIQRAVASNRLSFKFYKPGCDLRMEGDGSENPEDFVELGIQNNPGFSKEQYLPISNMYNASMRGKSPSNMCSDPNCKSPHCYRMETKGAGIEDLQTTRGMSNAMLDIVQNAEELRRLIRETSFDSLASDLSIGIHFKLERDSKLYNDQGLYDFEDKQYLQIENSETEDGEILSDDVKITEQNLWKLTDINDDTESSSDSESSFDHQLGIKPKLKEIQGMVPMSMLNLHSSATSEAGDDASSYVGSTLDSWEWDDECYFGDDTHESSLFQGQFEQNTLHKSWLPDTCRELDLETELEEKDFYLSTNTSVRSSRSASRRPIHNIRLPPSGSSSLERNSLSRLSNSSNTSEDITITGPAPHSDNNT